MKFLFKEENYKNYQNSISGNLLWLITIVFFIFLIFPTMTNAATLQKFPTNLGLVGYWPFNEGTSTIVGDFSGKGNFGTTTNISNPATITSGWGSGKSGKAMIFDGSNDYIGIADSASLHSSNGTFAAWVKLTSDDDEELYGIRGSANGFSIEIGINTTGNFTNELITLCVGTSGSCVASYETTNRAELFDGKWHHIVVTMDGDAHFYLDGVSKPVSGSATEWTADTANTLPRIGACTVVGCGTNALNGSLDEVRVYNRAITQSEVTALYKTGSVTHKAPTNLGLVGYWPFNEGTSTMAGDFSGKGNTGTLQTVDILYPRWTNGKFGKALEFAGTDGFVNVNPNSSIDNQTAITTSFWVKINSDPGSQKYFFRKADSGTTVGWAFFVVTPLRLGFQHVLTGAFLEGGSNDNTLTIGDWQHIVMVWDGSVDASNIKYYRNGVLLPHHWSDSIGSGVIKDDSTEVLWLGGDNANPPFDGSIDEMRLYNRALTEAEVMGLYQGSKTRFINSSQNTRLTSGLTGLWSFNGPDTDWSRNITFDRSGNGNTGRMINMSTSTAPKQGKVGQAFSFDGTNDTVSIGSSNLFPNAGNPMSISAWIWSGVGGCQQAQIVNRTDSGGNNGWDFYCDNGGLIVFDSWGTTNLYKYSAESINANEWTHVAVSWDGSTSYSNVHTYINGVETTCAACQNGSALVDVTGGSTYIGSNNNTQQYWTGKIDEVRTYNRVLSAQEIKQLYLMGK